MFFLAGEKNTSFIEDKSSTKCPNCGVNDFVLYSWQQYPHLYYVPIAPGTTKCIGKCKTCGLEVPYFKMNGFLKVEADSLKSKVKKPFWLYCGAALGVTILTLFIYFAITQKLDNDKYIASPQKNDVYEIKLKEDEFTCYKVTSIAQDSVYIVRSNWITDKEKSLTSLLTKEYDTTSFVLSKVKLKQLYTDKMILDIHREE